MKFSWSSREGHVLLLQQCAQDDCLTLFIAAPPNGSSVWVQVVDEVSGAVFEQEITADLPANRQFLSPRLLINNAATAAAVAYDCSGVYVETDS